MGCVPVVLAWADHVGICVQAERKIDKARSWYGRATVLDPDCGDFWALFYHFEVSFCSPHMISCTCPNQDLGCPTSTLCT